jgi:FkbM family methyltransferase
MHRNVVRQLRSFRKRYLRLRYGDRPFVTRYLGADFHVSLDTGLASEIAYHAYERERMANFLRLARRARVRVFFDIGANCGVYSCVMLKKKVAPRAIALEPDSRNLAALRANVALNGLTASCEIIGAAAGTAPAEMQLLHGPPDNLGQSKIVSEAGDETVDVVRIDDINDVRQQVIAAKFDVEGFELEALVGASETLGRNSGVVQIETYTHKAEVFRLMGDFGYRPVTDLDPDFVFWKDQGTRY